MAEGLSDYGANIYNNFKEGLNNVDIVMILRLPRERMQGLYSSAKEYLNFMV